MGKIYTRTGDKGKTGLFNGKRVLKSDLRIETLGTIDELNSLIGVLISNLKTQSSNLRKELIKIQNDLLDLGSLLANFHTYYILHTTYYLKRVREFENLIDEMTAQMPFLKNFIFPGGGKTGALLHLVRAVCRRAERRIVELSEKQTARKSLIIYFNRLSDLLFTLARFANLKEKKKEIIWPKK